MMQGFSNMMPGMSWAMGAIWLIVLIALIFGIAALVKYLFSTK